MIGMIGYLIGALVVAAVLTLLVSLVRPIKKHDDFLSWRVMLGLYIFVLAAPYGYVEVVTELNGSEMAKPVEETMVAASGKEGKLEYFKVLTCKDDKARVIAVGSELSTWGGQERPVMAINLEKSEGVWEPVEFNWVTSDDRGHDSVSLPPYW